jgi:hypothetical protein
MSNTPGVVTAVRWNDLCPWLLLVRAARVALLVRVIILATAGVLLTEWGWSAIEGVLLPDEPDQYVVPLDRLTDHPAPPLLNSPPVPHTVHPFDAVDRLGWSGPLVRGWAWAIQPLTYLAAADGWRASVAFALAGVWVLAVWALVGGAILRIAALYLTRGEILGPIAALQSSLSRWISAVAAPSFCLGVIAVFALLLMLGGLLIKLSPLALLAGLLWPVALAFGAAAAIFTIGLALGWPQMWATIAAERTDAFDGVSRGYAFTFQRPLHLVFFVIVATSLGLLAQIVVSVVVHTSLEATHWGVSRGAGNDIADALLRGAPMPEGTELRGMAAVGGRAMRFWSHGLRAVAASFPMAYLFAAAMGIYLLLRRLIDSTELSEVVLDDAAPGHGLPPLVADPKTGVPTVGAVAPEAPPAITTVSELRGGST